MLPVIGLSAGCETVPSGDYCDIALKPFEWTDEPEIDATPERPFMYIEASYDVWHSQGCKR